MYIHSYQIHNVLNDYRKQLSHGPQNKGGRRTAAGEHRDRISISTDGQRQAIMDKISSDIIARFTEGDPKNRFEAVITDRLASGNTRSQVAATGNAPDFKYTVIDEQNRKKTNTLTVQGFNPSCHGAQSTAGNDNGHNAISETE